MEYKYVKSIFIGYILMILLGGTILSLPISHKGELSFIDSTFTAASAVCVTGLSVTSTSENFTILGDLIILLLIQVGGIGYMSLVVIFFIFVKHNLNLDERMALKHSLELPNIHVISFLKKILLSVFIFELLGAVVLSLQFSQKFDTLHSIWYGIFHSISAFNNAGFSLFTSSFTGFRDDSITLITISLLVILGGLGYFVLIEIYENRKFAKRYSINTKLMLIGTAVLILAGMVLFLSIEWNNPKTFGNLNIFEKILNSFFLSINFRTSGFNTIDIGSLKESSIFFSTLFMMIGGGQGSTAGGMKITTVAILIVTVLYILKESNQQPSIFRRGIEQKVINRALAIIICSSFFVLLATLILVETQNLPFLKILFEVTSAFGTVGLSTGNGGILSFSQQFDTFGKSIIIIMMLAGRLGVFGFGLVLIGKAKVKHYKYPTERIII